MIYLLIVSLIWAFSFGLIKGKLTGLDSNLVSFLRLLISMFCFVPFMKFKFSSQFKLKLLFTGAIQYGIMYSAYIYSFQFLQSYEVALFTIFTPIYITAINDLLNRTFNKYFLLTSVSAVFGTIIVVYNTPENSNLVFGFVLVQLSNLCFAFGQIYYKKIMIHHRQEKDLPVFGWVYLGSLIFPLILTSVTTNYPSISISQEQIVTLLFLGIVATGVGFFLWNVGARITNTGALSVFNNMKIPLAITVSLLFFDEKINLLQLFVGGIIILASLLLNQYFFKNKLSLNPLVESNETK